MEDAIGKPSLLTKWLANQDQDKIFSIKEYKAKRSLSQNAYAWTLITQLANVLNKSKEDVYLQMLKDYGQSEVISIISDVVLSGYFKYFELIGNHFINGKEFVHVRIYKGSSNFDSKEMSVFIEGIIQECKQVGIETLTPNEIAKFNLM